MRLLAPSVLLRPDSNEAARLGSTTQEVLTELVWNDRGQLLSTIDAQPRRPRSSRRPSATTPWAT